MSGVEDRIKQDVQNTVQIQISDSFGTIGNKHDMQTATQTYIFFPDLFQSTNPELRNIGVSTKGEGKGKIDVPLA